VEAAAPSAGASPGDDVRLVLRPEAIEVVRGESAAAHWRAVVVSRVFLGEKIEYRMRCGGEVLHIVRYNAGPAAVLPEGEAVGLRLAEDAASLLPKAPG
jgi:hypothetical protein